MSLFKSTKKREQARAEEQAEERRHQERADRNRRKVWAEEKGQYLATGDKARFTAAASRYWGNEPYVSLAYIVTQMSIEIAELVSKRAQVVQDQEVRRALQEGRA